MEAVQSKGYGVIRVSAKLTFLADLGNPYTEEEWQKALLLPDEYTVVHVYYGVQEIEIGVESNLIPVDADHITQTEVTPYYSKIDGKAVLTCIEIKQWNGINWVKVQ